MQTSSAVEYAKKSSHPVIDKCEGCDRVYEANSVKYCKVYTQPDAKWRLGLCNFATHAKPEIKIVKVRINPLKASKRASRKKK